MTLQRQWIPTPNFSASRSRNQLMVLHSAEGATNFADLGGFFSHPNAGVSAHVGIDDTPGIIGEYANRDRKTWAAFNANDWGVHAELCAFAAWPRETWLAHPVMLRNVANWCVEEGAHYDIPCRHVDGAAIKRGEKGFCSHADVVAAGAGGDHWDPGTGFPWDVLEQLCAQIQAPVSTTGGNLMAFGPEGTRVDFIMIGAGQAVFHTWGIDHTDASTHPWENLGGQAKRVVKDGWTADKSQYVVAVIGMDDHMYFKTFNAVAGTWGGWERQTTGQAWSEPVPAPAAVTPVATKPVTS